MRYTRKLWWLEKRGELLPTYCKRWLLYFLAVILVAVTLLTACERGAHLTIENRMLTDVTIVHDGINRKGTYLGHFILGTIQAGQTVTLQQRVLVLRRDIIGWTVILKAEDPSGKVVW